MSRVRPREVTGTPRTGKLTAEQEMAIAAFRAALCLEVGVCEVCRAVEWPAVCGHEFIHAGGMRKYTKGNRSLVLVVCDGCHRKIHDEAWPIAKQLACLMVSRPLDFRLSAVNRWSIKRIQRADVLAFVREIEADRASPAWRETLEAE